MYRFKITMEYDGSCFHGWQCQRELKTIQGTLEDALSMITSQHVDVYGSGRTDAGVHALAQEAHFDLPAPINASALKKSLNSLFPAGLVIHKCMEVDPSFHARFSAIAKTYHYRILNRRLRPVLGRNHIWHVWRELDRNAMDKAACLLTGTHDFKSFEATGSPRTHTVRTLFHASFSDDAQNPEVFSFEVTANGFLRYMVRNLVGTLVQVGAGKIGLEEIPKILAGKNRKLAGVTAPAHGLFLKSVHYEKTHDFAEPVIDVRRPPHMDAQRIEIF